MNERNEMAQDAKRPFDRLVIHLKQRYEVDFKWRDAWTRLADKADPGRLAVTQEYIERRAMKANIRIKKLMEEYDYLCGV